ncbi:MAG: hypothetical protein ACOCQD_03665 [archaeon]
MEFKKGDHVKVANKKVLAKELQEMDIKVTGIIEEGGQLMGTNAYIIAIDGFEDKIQVVPEKYLERMDMVA